MGVIRFCKMGTRTQVFGASAAGKFTNFDESGNALNKSPLDNSMLS